MPQQFNTKAKKESSVGVNQLCNFTSLVRVTLIQDVTSTTRACRGTWCRHQPLPCRRRKRVLADFRQINLLDPGVWLPSKVLAPRSFKTEEKLIGSRSFEFNQRRPGTYNPLPGGDSKFGSVRLLAEARIRVRLAVIRFSTSS